MILIAQFGLFYGILVMVLILVYSTRHNKNKYFLGLSLFFVWYSLLIIYLNNTGQILKYPALQRTGVIASYLEFPFLFIYSRNTFYPGRMWKKTDLILLLPALIYIIDFMPFFLMPSEQKIALWHSNLANPERMFLADEGWLGLSGFHYPFIFLWIAFIMFFQILLIAKNWNLETGFKSDHNRRVLYFILTITTLFLPLEIPGIFGILFKAPWFNFNFISVTYGISLSAISIFLFVSPKILYGFLPEIKFVIPVTVSGTSESLPGKEIEVDKQTTVDIPQQEVSTKELSEVQEEAAELAILLNHMKQNKPFVKQGFTIQELSNQTGIPIYQLSPLINGHFKMNFANWINRFRVEHFLELAQENKQMTLEALSREAGFTSRSNFINAFKKEKGVTPREYLKEFKIQD